VISNTCPLSFFIQENAGAFEMDINVLITSASRKVGLVESFKAALKQEKVNGKVITVDNNPLSAAFYVSDKYYTVAKSSKSEFMPMILDICEKEKIKLLIPTRDGELLLFAQNKQLFKKKGTTVMVSPPEAIEICNDKYLFYKYLKKNNIPTPSTYLPNQINLASVTYPLIIKSKSGSGSKGIFKVENEKQLRFFLDYVSDPIAQEFVRGKEYTIDLFSDFSGTVLSVVPRERIETFGGESYKGKTVKDCQIIEETKKLAEKLGTIGHITVQCIENDGEIKFIEINPRFGGGASLGFAAGANTPAMLLKLLRGKKLNPSIGDFEERVMLRYTKDVFI